VGGDQRARTLRRYGGLRLRAVPAAGGADWFAVTQDETVTLGRFESLERATACFEAARAAAIAGAGPPAPAAGAGSGAGDAPAASPPPNVTDLDAYRWRRRR
jgi:hypothetical protein